MPQYYPEYYYTWGYAATSLALVFVALIAGIAIVRQFPSIGAWLLIAGAILTTGSLAVNDLSWLILAGGDNMIDGLKEPGRMELLDTSGQIVTGMRYFGALAIVLSLLFLSRDFGAIRRQRLQNKEAEQAGTCDAEEAV